MTIYGKTGILEETGQRIRKNRSKKFGLFLKTILVYRRVIFYINPYLSGNKWKVEITNFFTGMVHLVTGVFT